MASGPPAHLTTSGRSLRTAVLLHGFTGSSDGWSPHLLDGLVRAGVFPRPLDLPGHGRQRGVVDPARHSLDVALAEVDDVVTAAEGGGTTLIGYSMGGRIALHYAIRYPDRLSGLILESASPGLATATERSARHRADASLAREIVAGGIEAFVDRWSALPLFESQRSLTVEARRALRARRLLNDPASLAAALGGLGTGALPSLWDRLADLRVPTLLLTGALDEKFVKIAERMSALIPDCRHHRVAHTGHCVHLEAPDAWVAAVTNFLTTTR